MDKFIFGDSGRVRVKGSLAFEIKEVNGEPAVCIAPRFRALMRGRIAPNIICLSAMHQYFRDDGYPTPYAVRTASAGLQAMGMEASSSDFADYMDIMYEFADDVVRLPPDVHQRRERDRLPDYIEAIEIDIDGRKRTIENR